MSQNGKMGIKFEIYYYNKRVTIKIFKRNMHICEQNEKEKYLNNG